MSFLPISGILHSNENFDATANMTGADAIAPDESNTLAAAVSEINSDEAAISAGNDQIDAASIAADGLETISEQVAAANEGEGIDETAAAVIEASVESLLKISRIGVKYKQLGIPSSESFSVRSNRIALGKATCEALDISAKKIWQSIVDAIKKSIEWVRNFFNKIFGAAERLERRAKTLKDGTTSLTGKAEETTLENDSLFNAVRVNGAPVAAGHIQTLAATAKKIFAEQKKVTDEFAKLELDGGMVAPPTPTSYGMQAADSGTAKRVTAEADVSVFMTHRFPGESVVYMTVGKSTGGGVKDNADFANKIRAGSVNLADKKEEGKSLKVLGVDEIRGMAEAVEKFAAEVSEYKRGLTEVNNNKTKFIGKLEKFLSKGDGKNEKDSKGDAEKKAKSMATVFRKLMDEPAASFASHSIRAMSSALQYAELSARQYEKKD
jgi:hypothetical protein